MIRIQLVSILASLSFLYLVGKLIRKGRLREEYAIIWIVGTIALILFSFWRDGLEQAAHLFGVFDAPNLAFSAATFAILIYLLHLSLVVSRLHEENKKLAQTIALLNVRKEEPAV